MNPGEAADLKGALDSAAGAMADKWNSKAKVKARLEFLLWRVIQGNCSDFFADGGQPTVTEYRFTNPETNQTDTYSRCTYTTAPQWQAAPDHCRYKGNK